MNERGSGSETGDREKRIQLGQENEIMGETGRTSAERGHTLGETGHASSDAERVREALQEHRWPEAGEALMARLRAIPGEAPAQVEAGADVGRPPVSHLNKAGRSPASRPTGRLEALGAIAIVAAVALMILRGAGDGIAPADESEQGIADATRTAEAGALATARAEAGSGESVDGSVSEESYAEGRSSAMGSVESGDEAGAGDGSGAVTAAPPPMPPEGTRLYGSVAELLAERPRPGETVWVDAYHGEVIVSLPGWGRASSMSGCPNRGESPLLDRPHLLQISAFNRGFGTTPPDPANEPMLVAAGIDAEGEYTTLPDLPRYGRLVLRLGDPEMAECREAVRIAVVEDVAHIFEEKTDWVAVEARIRASSSNGATSGHTLVGTDPDGGADIAVGAYEIPIPVGLESLDTLPRTSLDIRAVDVALAMPELLDHPINLSRYLPGHPEYEALLNWVETELRERSPYRQRIGEGAQPAAEASIASELDFLIDGLYSDTGDPIAIGTSEISAFTVVDDVVYRISTTPPADPLQAQPLLWWLETIVDRFHIPESAGDGAIVLSPDGTRQGPGEARLELLANVELGFEVQAIAADGGRVLRGSRVLVGGPRLAVLRLGEEGGDVRSVTLFDLPSPVSMGLTSESDVERVAMQVTGRDREEARSMLSNEFAPRGVQALAIRSSTAYAAVEWPLSSGLVWLYVIAIDSTSGPTVYGAARLADPAEAAESPYVNVMGRMEVVGSRLLVGTSAGLLEVDIADSAAPRVLSPDPDLWEVLSGLAVTPGAERAYAASGTIDRGGLLEIDLTGSSASLTAGGLAADAAFLDVATDGISAFVTTGDEFASLRVLDVGRRGEAAREIGRVTPTEGRPISVALHGRRLYALATNLTGAAATAYPGPDDPLGPGRFGVLVYDITDPANPALVALEPLPNLGNVIEVDSVTGMLLVGDDNGHLRVYGGGGGR